MELNDNTFKKSREENDDFVNMCNRDVDFQKTKKKKKPTKLCKLD